MARSPFDLSTLILAVLLAGLMQVLIPHDVVARPAGRW